MNSDHQILRLRGALTINTLFPFQTAVRELKASSLIVDLSGLTYVDSAGIGSIVAAYIGFKRTGQQLALVGMNDRVRTMLDMTHVTHLFKTYATVEEAEAALVQ